MSTSEKDLELQIERREPAPSGGGPLSSATIAAGLAFVIAAIAAATLGVALNIKTTLEESGTTVHVAFDKGSTMNNHNYCNEAKPTAAAFDNVDCATAAVEQAGGNVTLGWTGGYSSADTPITTPYFQAGLCPVNVHWHLGAEHLSYGEYDGQGYGPGGHRRVTEEEDARRLAAGARLGGRCHLYDSSQEKFTKEYDWKHCVGMHVGETYEVHWPHSDMGACGTPNQYQTPFYDGVFCNLLAATADTVGSEATGTVPITSYAAQIGVQAQIFTIVNDENYYYPDLMRGMIVDGDKGTQITGYTGSTTGTTRNNQMCSKFAPITWHVDRKCHMISASTFDKMCADMKSQRDDMSGDLYAHGAREVVIGRYVANNQQDLAAAYTHA